MAQKIVFLKTEWMQFYDGRRGDKPPRPTFKHTIETGRAHEDHNFAVKNGKLRAYAPIAGGGSGIRIKNLGADPDADHLDGVDVIFLAADPAGGGVKIVGWYRNARVFRHLQTRNGRSFLAECVAGNQKLLGVDDRTPIAKPPRRANVWYGRSYVIAEVRRLMDGRNLAPRRKSTSKHDVEACFLVEHAAYNAVISKFEEDKFAIKLVQTENKGWDLEATKHKQTLKLEVKGRTQKDIRAELTPREYAKSQEHESYRICIVTDACQRIRTCTYLGETMEGFGMTSQAISN